LRIYVGNLPYEFAEEELKQAFIAYGQVETTTVIRDRDSGRSKGFGFVEMPQAAEAKAAIEALNGKQINSRNLTVNEAKPREQRTGGSGGGFGGGQGGRGGGRDSRY